MHVPFIDLKRAISPLHQEIGEGWEDILKTCSFVGGKSVTTLETKLQKFLDVDYFVSCANGTDALIIGLQALGVKPGQKVAMTNLTFWAPYEAIRQIGCEAVLIDISKKDLQMDFEEFKKAYEKHKFEAAILVHLYGWTSEYLEQYRTFCKENNIILLEDGAQAFGAKIQNKSIFSGADICTMSFYPAKVFGGCSDGGGIAINNPILADKVRALCNHGRAGHYTYDYVGWNSRLSGLHAVYLLAVLPHFEKFLESRKRALEIYSEEFSPYKEQIKLFKPPKGQTGNHYLSVLTCADIKGDKIVEHLTRHNIGSARTYPQTISQQPPAKNAFQVSDLKNSTDLTNQVINLPVFAGITEDECRISAKTLIEILEKEI